MTPAPPPWARRAAAGTLAALLLAGCSEDGTPQSDPGFTPSATPQSPSTTPADAPTRPALPDEATKPTMAGAEAFIHHYWDLINYAQLTGNTGPLRRISAPTCDGCKAGETQIEELYEAGGRATGGEYRIEVTKLTEVESEVESLYAFEALIRARNATQEVVNGDGTRKTLAARTTNMLMYVHWVRETWRVDVMEVR